MAQGQIKTGTYTGTGAAINIELGFSPDYVMVTNYTDGTPQGYWTSGMGAGTAIDIAAAVATNATNGITAYAGAAGATGAGFTAGTDYSTDTKVYVYLAVANQ